MRMMVSSCFLLSFGAPPSTPSSFETAPSSPRTIFSWTLQSGQLPHNFLRRSDRQALQVPRGKRTSKAEVLMVDPLEAKRLAVKQMQEIQAKERFKRQRRIEAINGAWAMIGLTAGLVVEGHTGNSIPAQKVASIFRGFDDFWILLVGYWVGITSLLFR